ncbi:MAG: AAA family ATPase [Bdellovibrionaceae bacterium]|nr:AAA family ATPase [Pseudobdellovibrionaceae bacterium]
MYQRSAEYTLRELAKFYPVVSVTGPRQSGKTTLTRKTFPEKKYISLENLDHRRFAEKDPRRFLAQSENGLIIDEAQNCPDLFSYIQGLVDEQKDPGKYILTGSQQFGLMTGITQSLAGRVGIIELLPFSIKEIETKIISVDETLSNGFYPPIYDRNIPSDLWYADYIRTYVERDVRKLIQIKDLSLFQKFLRLCAARAGHLINFTELSNSTGIDVRTVKSWISVLEASYIIFLLQPHYRNLSKKLVKTPKLYFYDVGLLSHLLQLRKEDISITPYRGNLFENMIIGDIYKTKLNFRKNINFYFWRDNKGVEVDLVYEENQKIHAIEIKSNSTINESFFKNLSLYKKYLGTDFGEAHLIYGGPENQLREHFKIHSWKNSNQIFD